MEITAGSHLTCRLEGGIEIAEDCQIEFGYRTSLDFKPFESNFATLLVRPRKSHPSPNIGHLIIKKAFGHITECHAEAVTTINLDLRDSETINQEKTQSQTQSPHHEDYEDVPNGPKTEANTDVNNTDKNVIQVKEYSPRDDDNDIVFVRMAS